MTFSNPQVLGWGISTQRTKLRSAAKHATLSHTRRLVATLLLSWTVCPLPADSPESDVRLERRAEGFLFVDAGLPVLFYQLEPKLLDGRARRANYIHPLHGLDGEILTEDFPADHIHHRGVFWAWHQVTVKGRKMGDAWLAQDFLARVVSAEPVAVPGKTATLRVRAEWVSPALTDAAGTEQPFLDEVTTVRVQRVENDVRKIDFEIRLTPRVDDVSLGGSQDDKGYGGFSVRARLPEDLRFLGSRGPLTPRRGALKAARWVDLVGSFRGTAGRPAGISILCHPSLPGFPQPWILRSQASMQNPVWPGRRPVALTRDKPLSFRYRLLVHRGDLSRDQLERLQTEYESEP